VIVEVAILDVGTVLGAEFEAAFQVASKIIMTVPGYISHARIVGGREAPSIHRGEERRPKRL
jgi:heme-degrading monooxygenase HmoA